MIWRDDCRGVGWVCLVGYFHLLHVGGPTVWGGGGGGEGGSFDLRFLKLHSIRSCIAALGLLELRVSVAGVFSLNVDPHSWMYSF